MNNAPVYLGVFKLKFGPELLYFTFIFLLHCTFFCFLMFNRRKVCNRRYPQPVLWSFSNDIFSGNRVFCSGSIVNTMCVIHGNVLQ